MKKLLIIIFLIFSIAACTNGSHRTRTERMEDHKTKMMVEDDGETMSIKVKIKNDQNPVDYTNSFDVRDLNDQQKDKLKHRILDSLYAIK